MKKIIIFYLTSLIFCFEYDKALAQAGALDSTFGTNGIGAYSFTDGANSTVIQSDGKILIGGVTLGKFAVARFKTNGTLDSSFGMNGKKATLVGLNVNGYGRLTLQPDGKILQTGTCEENNGKYSFGTVRYNTDGTVDNTFSGDGVTFTSFNSMGYGDGASAAAVQPDGKIVVIGGGYNNAGVAGFEVVRYNSDGSTDYPFGQLGKVFFTIGNPYPAAFSVIIQPDGKILIGGDSFSDQFAPCCFALARLNADGTLDNTFNSDGKVTTYFGAGGSNGVSLDIDQGLAMALQSDGKILLTGTSFLGSNNYSTLATVRYNTDGSLDNSFGIGGKLVTLIPDYINAGANCIAIQADNKIVVAGSCAQTPELFILMVRYLSDGTVDSSFGSNGIAITAFDTTQQTVEAIAIQNDNKIVGAGYYLNHGMFVARFLPGLVLGVIDLAVSNNPLFIYPNPIQSQATLQYTLTQDEHISIELFDIQGKLVQQFFTNETRATGKHEEVLHLNELLPSGTYILNISNGKNSQGVKIVKE